MDKIYQVKNRSTSMVVYTIPEEGIRREFAPGEAKKINHYELEKLTYQAGGRELIADYLLIQDDEAIADLNIEPEVEYYMTEAEVAELLAIGSLDAFLDALDFAPVGVIDLIKTLSVSLPLNSIEKRRALKEKTGFDVDAALRHMEEEKIDDKEEKPATTGRRVAPAANTGRRVETTGKYKVVNKVEDN